MSDLKKRSYEVLARDMKKPRNADEDFWKIKHEDPSEFDEIANTESLWITNIEGTNSKKGLLPKFEHQSPIVGTRKINSTLKSQQEKHLKAMQEKQPTGRDGKKLPIPRQSLTSSVSSLNPKLSARKNLAASQKLISK